LPTSTQTVENTSSFLVTNYKLLLNRDLVFIKETQYYVIDGNKHYAIANKKNIEKLFPKQKNILESYLNKNQVDFKKEPDLKNIFMYMAKSY